VVGCRQGGQDGLAFVSAADRKLSRRQALAAGAGGLATLLVRPSLAQEEAERHGMSYFGDLKYPPDFQHFDYVNPDAPKGGIFSTLPTNYQFNQSLFTFNSLNAFILTGDSPPGIDTIYATLMAPATIFWPTHDEPDACYGLTARAVRISEDGLTYRFLLRPEARFHDGSALTAQDVVFTLTVLKEKGHPIIQQQLRDFSGAEAPDDLTVVARFAPGRGRDVPLFVAQLPIFSRAYYSTRPFDQSTLDVPLGSGPYRVGRFEAGRFIEYDRVRDWWGVALPVMRGFNNFNRLRYEFYRDMDVAYEGFTAKNYLFREEASSRLWATRYDAPSVRDGRIKKEVLPDDTPSGAQGWFINTRREKFRDPRMREALISAFDFEWTNRNIMFGAYKRTHSVFQNSDMMAEGKPSPEELALLEPFRGRVPEEVFGDPYVPPVSDGSGQDRALLRRAAVLLRSAGYVIKDGKRFTPKGEQLTIEFLNDEPVFQPHHLPYIKNLGVLGIDASFRLVDAAQYQQRLKDYDFDLTIERFQFSSTPGDGLRPYFTSQAAAVKGTQNLAGIADPVIDALVDRIIAAPTRDDLTFACRALDRVFRAGRYWVPQWYNPSFRIAYWDVFDRPATKPRYGRGAPETWWYDRDKAAKLERGG
jgi:microcin C transport system substrate-binding protein